MKTIFFSIDALIRSDLEYFKLLPNMKKLLDGATVVDKIMSVYPTYTYVCHASMISGFYPDKTGIQHNFTWPDQKWMFERSYTKVPLITDILKEHGYSTAAVTFPGTAADMNLDVCVPETWAENPDDDADPVFRRMSNPAGYEIYQRHKNDLDWMRTPGMDIYATNSFIDILDTYKPDFAMLHLSYLDHQRHLCGMESENVEHAIRFIDEMVGKIIPHADGYQWIILGDHGHRNVYRQFSINRAIAEMGYADVVKVHSVSFSAQVYPENISDEECLGILYELKKRYPDAIDEIHDRQALEKKRATGKYSFMIDSVDGVVFYQGLDRPIWFKDETANGNHGYAPERGPFSPLIFANGFVKTDATECNLTDITPTVLSLYGIDYKCDGKALDLYR